MKALLAFLAGRPDLDPAERELRLWAFAAGATVLLAGLAFLAWGLLAPLDGAVVASGSIRVENARQQVQHQEGGLVKRILVKNGDKVQKDQELLEIEDLRVSASTGIIRQSIAGELAKQARLAAERDFRERIVFPPTLTQKADDPFISSILAKEQELFEQRRRTLHEQLDVLGQQIAETGREIEATRQQVAADEASSKAMEDELKAHQGLLEKGFISPTRMYGLQRSVAEYRSRLAEHRADLSLRHARIRQQAVGHDFGERITMHHEVERYLQALEKAAPTRIKVVKYAETWEGRPLYNVFLASPENIARLEAELGKRPPAER
jgi:HlyD family type I secretion membrane fusion protein